MRGEALGGEILRAAEESVRARKTAGACFWCTPGSCDLITNMPPSQYKDSNLRLCALSHRPHE